MADQEGYTYTVLTGGELIPENFQDIVGILRRLDPDDFYPVFIQPKPGIDDIERYRQLASHVGGASFVALCYGPDQTLVGFSEAFRFPENQQRAEVGIIVDSAHRNRGFGHGLVSHLLQRCADTGISEISCEVWGSSKSRVFVSKLAGRAKADFPQLSLIPYR